MAAVRNSDEKEVESVEDYTQELSGSHTSSPPPTTTTTNDNSSSSVGRQQCQSLDTHQSLLNGSQPNPFVCGGILVAPHTDDSLPSGALVNGSASHCTSEEPRVPNKDASPLPRTDTNPQVLEPPSELQSNTWRKPEGHILKVSSARTLYESDSSDCDAPLAWDNADNGPISRLQTSNGFEAGSLWDADCDSDSSSENYEGLNKNLREKFMCLLLKRGILDGVVKRKMEVEGLQPNSLSRRKQKLCKVKRIPVDGEVNDGFGSNTDSDSDSSVTKDPSLRKEPESLKAYMESSLRNYCSKKSLISSDKVGGQDEAEIYVGGKPVPLKRRLETGSESELSFFQCTKCNANFKEKKQLQRHMMYHLDQHNQGRQESVLHPFICKECGRSFRESSSLQKHMLIHQLRQERLMKEIKGLNEMRNKGSQCTIRTDCCQTLSRHAKTHEKDKPYYSCEESNHVALRKEDVEAHQCTTPLDACQDGFLKTFGVYFCKLCTFTSRSRNVFREHLETHSEAFSDNELDSVDTRSVLNQNGLADQTKAEDSSPALPKPPPFGFRENQNGKSGTDLSVPSSCLDDLYPKGNSAQKSYQESSSSLFKRRFGSLANNLSASFLQCDKPSKSSVPTERTDVTTGFWNVAEDNQKCEKTNSLSSFDVHPATEFATSSKVPRLNDDSDVPTKDPSASDLVVPIPRRKSPSKRKMSTPYHNAPKTAALILQKRELESLEEMSWQDHYAFQYARHESTGDAIVLNGEDEESSPCTTDHFIPQGLHIKEEDAHDSADFDGHVEDSSEITTFIVKEENIESALSDDNEYQLSDSYASYRLSPMFEAERKRCPYCPAVFDSGVGLSNHIRGHLHRLGLRYEARHMLSPEQVASQDWQPRIRRRVHAMSKSIRRAEKPDSQTEYTCPLCMGWFDTKTGLSNHVRGHLKRIGMPITGLSKSPLSILTELLQDEHEHGNILRALKVKPSISKSLVCRKFAGSKDLLLSPKSIPDKIQHSTNGLLSEEEEKRKSRETVNRIRETSSSTLVELLKKERLDLEQEDTGRPQTGRARFMVPPSRRVSTGGQYKELNSICNQEKNEPNKRICIHCNATFHSGVSLSNHLRAYERRKRIALQEGLSYDCSPVCTRSRSGPKMKPFQTARTTSEVIYSLSCRFCDLVFEGPQCVQEDWVKHLQRHLMHTTVSGSGAPMVEIPTVAAVCDRSCGLDLATQGL